MNKGFKKFAQNSWIINDNLPFSLKFALSWNQNQHESLFQGFILQIELALAKFFENKFSLGCKQCLSSFKPLVIHIVFFNFYQKIASTSFVKLTYSIKHQKSLEYTIRQDTLIVTRHEYWDPRPGPCPMLSRGSSSSTIKNPDKLGLEKYLISI